MSAAAPKSETARAAGRGVRGARGLLLALAGGAATALAHPPFGVWPGIFGFALIAFSLDRSAVRRPLLSALARGWAAGFAYLLVGTWWIAEAFFVDAATHAWQAPLAIAFTAGGIGVFWGGAGLVYRLIAPQGGHRVLVFAAVWSLFEWLRGHVLTGFPWDLPGEAWRAGSAPSQAASLIGAYGMTFVTIAIGSAPLTLTDRDRPRAAATSLAFAGAALALLWGFGAIRLAQPEPPDQALRLRVVQPGLAEEPVWTEGILRRRVDRFMRLTAWPAAKRPDLVIWPEGAMPYSLEEFFAEGSGPAAALARAMAPGQVLFDGGYRVDYAAGRPRYYNSMLVVRRTAEGFRPQGVYDKYRLVPFGEFLPVPWLFSLIHLTSLVQNGVAFTSGPVPAPITPPGLPRVQPLICYEALFPGFTSAVGGRPDWIVNISDDAWFGRTTGPLQHLNLASYRAIEEGLPIVRATPTGVSAIVDARGRVRAHLGLGRQGVIDGLLPGRLAPTLYSYWHELPFYVFLLIGLSFSLVRPRSVGPDI